MIKELIEIQKELKAPKGQRNTFGNYNYRSCEDILEAVKPLLASKNAQLTLSDEIVAVNDRIYVKATATFTVANESVVSTAFAREALEKKGMDASQITGTASSYARKYALNGLFLIDDSKDSDTNEQRTELMNNNPEYAQLKSRIQPYITSGLLTNGMLAKANQYITGGDIEGMKRTLEWCDSQKTA